jgi:hypothetical protein
MAPPETLITLYLDGALTFPLNSAARAGSTPTLKVQMKDKSHAATLLFSGYQPTTRTINLPLALQSGLFALTDTSTSTVVTIPSSKHNAGIEDGKLEIEACEKEKHSRNLWFDLAVDPSDDFWTQLLAPGHSYSLFWRLSDDGKPIPPRAYRSSPQEDLPVETLSRTIKLNVLDAAAKPPHLTISIHPTSSTCHLSGTPRFGLKFRVVLKSEEHKAITVCLDKTPLKDLHGIGDLARVVNTSTGKEIDWPWGIGCFDGQPAFPDDEAFEEFREGVPWEETFWLEKDEGDEELAFLEADGGKEYEVGVAKGMRTAFTKWRAGTKSELLVGGAEEKQVRWKGSSGVILIECGEPFTFKTV